MLLAGRHGLVHISTGNLFRQAKRSGSELGRRAASFMDRGLLVPDALVRSMAERAIADAGCDAFVLDGYPRTVTQASWLSDFLGTRPVQAVILMEASDDELVRRLSRRRMHRETGEIFHLDTKPPTGIDPSLIFQRPDDRPEAIRRRLGVYRDQTEPVVAYYRDRGSLALVNAEGDVDAVYARIAEVLTDESPEHHGQAAHRP